MTVYLTPSTLQKDIFCFLLPLVFSRVPPFHNYSLDILHLVCVSPAAVMVNTGRLAHSHTLHSAWTPLQSWVCELTDVVIAIWTTAAAKTLRQLRGCRVSVQLALGWRLKCRTLLVTVRQTYSDCVGKQGTFIKSLWLICQRWSAVFTVLNWIRMFDNKKKNNDHNLTNLTTHTLVWVGEWEAIVKRLIKALE